MAKNRNKKKKNSDKAPMDTTEITVTDTPQDMDTSETVDKSSNLLARKIKGVQMKRSKNVRRKKAVAKAIAKVEKYSEKSTKLETKRMRVRSAKTLYD